MGVLTDLVVAPHDDGDAIAATANNERTWPWKDAKGLGVEDLAVMHCLLDRRDPDKPCSPPEWEVNPFTKKRMAVTELTVYLRAFDLAGEHDEAVVLRAPSTLTAALAKLTPTEAADLAQRWSTAKSAQTYGDGSPVEKLPASVAAGYVDEIVELARKAVELRHELFVWVCP